MQAWQATTLSPDFRIDVVPGPALRDKAVMAAVEAIWEEAIAERPGLFNGRVFSADRVSAGCIVGHWTEYRFGLAQMRRPELFEALGVRPVAVNGVITCPDGIVFGRRDPGAVYQAGLWQCPPAGSIERREGDGERVDLEAQLLAELEEELNLTAADVGAFRPLSAVEHPGSHVIDIGIAIETRLSATAIAGRHADASGRAEYDRIVVVPLATLDAQLEEWADRLVPPARSFLAILRAGV
jgi:hypothetical protein